MGSILLHPCLATGTDNLYPALGKAAPVSFAGKAGVQGQDFNTSSVKHPCGHVHTVSGSHDKRLLTPQHLHWVQRR